ncbi:RagB/SusD family nutrient uptake outer membrane protein [Marinilabiliaceae bacterium ANBcel2]|nr:RagB/SusD family nutrient uptake outer membrane protein [Marinilabiliaceae bacterium ANBcel2]
MKKYISIFLFSLIIASCGDSFLDVAPKDALSPATFWQSEDDLELALTGLYAGFESGGNLLYRDCGSDNAYNNFPWEGWRSIGDGTMTPANPGAGYFSYTTINRCNEFIDNLRNVDLPDDKLDIYEAQARFVRAYKYYQMVVNYGDVPLVLENFESPDEAKVPRDDKEKVIEFVKGELTDIIDVLPESYPSSDYGKATKGAAQALLMRFNLYYGNYEAALQIARDIEGYELFPNYQELFNPENQQNQEIILSVQHTQDDYQINLTPFMPNGSGGWSSVVPTQALVDSYRMADGRTIEEAKADGDYDPQNPYVNRDPRLRATVIYPGQMWQGEPFRSVESGDANYYQTADNATKSGYNFRKYINFLDESTDEQYWNTGLDIYIFRYAEVLLTIAEAKVELNEIDEELYDALDLVRERAGMPAVDRSVYDSQEKLRELVRNERRVEFAGEGLRRDDIIRWGIASDVMNEDALGVRLGEVLDTQQANGDYNVELTEDHIFIESRRFDDRHNLLPIPQSAIDRNTELEPNNPGY